VLIYPQLLAQVDELALCTAQRQGGTAAGHAFVLRRWASLCSSYGRGEMQVYFVD